MIEVGTKVRLKPKVAEAWSRSRMGRKWMWLRRQGVVSAVSNRDVIYVIWNGRKTYEPVPRNALEEVA